ncbi:transposase [Candidatus Peribacteria bacterium]|nr:transposase [Candidatus Peribacteria bacterium]
MRLTYVDYWDIHHRKSTRLSGRDYAADGMYFVTICTVGREHLLGEIVCGNMVLNEFGEIADDCWRELPQHFPFVGIDAFVVMPNHVHGILEFGVPPGPECRGTACRAPTRPRAFRDMVPGSLASVIAAFKSAATKRINILRNSCGGIVWQRNFHDHIIRNADELGRIRHYIAQNPARWSIKHHT